MFWNSEADHLDSQTSQLGEILAKTSDLQSFLTANFRPLVYTHPRYVGQVLDGDVAHPLIFKLLQNPRFSKRINHILIKGLGLDSAPVESLQSAGQLLLLQPWSVVQSVVHTTGLLCCYRAFSQRLINAQITSLSDHLGEAVVSAARQLRLAHESQILNGLIDDDALLLEAIDINGREVLSHWLRQQPKAFQRRFLLRLPESYLRNTTLNDGAIRLFEDAAKLHVKKESAQDE